MLFNSFNFLFLFLPVALIGALSLRGRALMRWICLASFFFYAFAGHVWFVLPMLVTTVLDFFVGQKIEAADSASIKRRWLWLSLAGNLGLLAYFKYAGLFYRTIEAVSQQGSPAMAAFFSVVLPAGISFYTFQTISYIIDIYRGECRAERDFWRFAGFVSFFPHLVAGPLTRHNQLIPQLEFIEHSGIRPRWSAGLSLFAVGLSKKILIGDPLGRLVDLHLVQPDSLGIVTAWAALLGYSLQIYFDFSGYSDMAIGLGRLFGIELPQNFNEPYRAKNPSDFWARWHITLSLWLRDYLYISLGGNRCSPWRRNFNLMATMVLGGLWHGASWTFAAWGIFHGAILVAYHATGGPWDRLPLAAQRALTFFLICIGWVFFRSDTFTNAAYWMEALFGMRGFGALNLETLKLAGMVAVSLFCVHILRRLRMPGGELGAWTQAGLGVAAGMALLLMNNSSKFLYFQF